MKTPPYPQPEFLGDTINYFYISALILYSLISIHGIILINETLTTTRQRTRR